MFMAWLTSGVTCSGRGAGGTNLTHPATSGLFVFLVVLEFIYLPRNSTTTKILNIDGKELEVRIQD